MDDAFYVEGTGSSLLLEGLSLERNVVPTTPWNGVSVRTGAIARINESSISDNVAMEFGVVAFDSRGVWISDSFLNRNAGSVRVFLDGDACHLCTDQVMAHPSVFSPPGRGNINQCSHLCHHGCRSQPEPR